MTIIYEAKPPTCLGANASQIPIMITMENADQIVVENLLYIAILQLDVYKKDLQSLSMSAGPFQVWARTQT